MAATKTSRVNKTDAAKPTESTQAEQNKEEKAISTIHEAANEKAAKTNNTEAQAENTQTPLTHFKELNAVNVNQWVEKKKTGGVELSYLSWANAWAQVKSRYPDATYRILRFDAPDIPWIFQSK